MTKKIFKNTIFIINLGVISEDIIVSISNSIPKAVTKAKLPKLDTAFDYQGFSYEHKGKYYIFLLEDSSYGTIAHECLHIISYILYGKDIKFELENHEIFAYSVGYLVDKICNYEGEERKD